jgi:hypothetical protein
MGTLFCFLLAGLFIAPAAMYGQYRLCLVFASFFALLGAQEWLSKVQTGKSVSQHFWLLDSINPYGAWVILVSLAIGWVFFLVHLKFN